MNEDMKKAKKLFNKCFALMCERNEKYGDSWKKLTIQSVANLIEMKMNRLVQLGFVGQVGCAIYNLSGGLVEIERGERIGQMVFFEADPASEYDG